ncbi:type II toxin-antitoxin system prevent-host-death family antitoxin [Pseudochelatococcus sp. B33]
MASLPASEIQKNFGEWHDRAHEGPVEITRYGRTTAFLVSARLFEELWSSYRQALPVEALSEGDIALIRKSRVATDQPYDLGDIPDIEENERPSKPRT